MHALYFINNLCMQLVLYEKKLSSEVLNIGLSIFMSVLIGQSNFLRAHDNLSLLEYHFWINSQWFHQGKSKQPRIVRILVHLCRALLSSSLLPKNDFRFCLQFFQLMWSHLYTRKRFNACTILNYSMFTMLRRVFVILIFEMSFFRRETCNFHQL